MVERSGGRGVTVVEERCGGGGVIVGMERPKTEVAGLPPQAWHEAAFTRIARIRGEVIFPEKYHFGDNDDEADNGNQGDKDHGEDMEDEDDIFDDGSECDIFLHQDFDNYQGEGGWIRDEVSGKDPGEHHDKDSPEKGMVDDTSEYSNTPVDLELYLFAVKGVFGLLFLLSKGVCVVLLHRGGLVAVLLAKGFVAVYNNKWMFCCGFALSKRTLVCVFSAMKGVWSSSMIFSAPRFSTTEFEEEMKQDDEYYEQHVAGGTVAYMETYSTIKSLEGDLICS
ncbi:hypothetical protein Tco_1288534 [Tanacetum coccineum]